MALYKEPYFIVVDPWTVDMKDIHDFLVDYPEITVLRLRQRHWGKMNPPLWIIKPGTSKELTTLNELTEQLKGPSE